jgi:hypothetical protein
MCYWFHIDIVDRPIGFRREQTLLQIMRTITERLILNLKSRYAPDGGIPFSLRVYGMLSACIIVTGLSEWEFNLPVQK